MNKVLDNNVSNIKIIPTYYLILFYGVDGVTILEPCDKKIITNLGNKYNIFHNLILLMKLDTQTYYNIRMALGLECI